MRRNRHPRPFGGPSPATPSEDLQPILDRLESADPAIRAAAVRELCPCRGVEWNVPVFPHVLALRDDYDPVVRNAVIHDFGENPEWGERPEARRLAGRLRQQEMVDARREISPEAWAAPEPPPHSMAWRMRPRARGKWRR